MQLATIRTVGGPKLHARVEEGYVDVSDALGDQRLADVGAMLEAGSVAVDAVRLVIDAPGGRPRIALSDVDLAPPIVRPRTIICIGRNYPEHIAEGKASTPRYPLLFSKFPNTLVGCGDDVLLPNITRELDYEGELAAVIGRTATTVSAASALDFVAGFTIINDVSARDLQAADLQWIRGKSLDTFAPVGPTFVSIDEIPAVDDLVITTTVNGERRQHERCAAMIFKLPHLLEFITEAITLQPGDIIATGTPSGTGIGFDPPKYLRPGDVVEVSIEPIGTLRSTVRARS